MWSRIMKKGVGWEWNSIEGKHTKFNTINKHIPSLILNELYARLIIRAVTEVLDIQEKD
jgi:hypothetical protein